MLQHLLRRLVFDVPILNEYAKMPLKVCQPTNWWFHSNRSQFSAPVREDVYQNFLKRQILLLRFRRVSHLYLVLLCSFSQSSWIGVYKARFFFFAFKKIYLRV